MGGTLEPSIVDAAVAAVRSAIPGVPVGVTTGAWALGVPDASRLIPQWTVKPDHASVNWHEDRAEEVAAALFSAGIAVHAGLWLGTDGAERAALVRAALAIPARSP
jgi:uncharacterized protein (DUF849 family)